MRRKSTGLVTDNKIRATQTYQPVNFLNLKIQRVRLYSNNFFSHIIG